MPPFDRRFTVLFWTGDSRPHEFFRVGLDAGCGTGHSAVALAKYCERVFGLDPSQSMLDVAQRHPKIAYLKGSGDALGQ